MFELDPWQRRQAAMLYHFSSLDYLKGLHRAISRLIDGIIDPVLHLAAEQGRDAVLVDKRWGNRNTSDNWATNAWPLLKDLQASIAQDIGLRAFEDFRITSLTSTLRGIDEFSMAWATEEEEEAYLQATAALCRYADPIDRTLDREPTAGWNDFELAEAFLDFVPQIPRIPSYRVKTDIVVETGKIPYRTGVYVSADDPNSSLQFAWAGITGCPLLPATTFSEIGLHALKVVGRSKLWRDELQMLAFATRPEYKEIFEDFILFDGVADPELAAGAISEEAFAIKPSRWHLVEIISEGGEDTQMRDPSIEPLGAGPRLAAGETCKQPGYYFSPAHPDSHRHLNVGDIAPQLNSRYGDTFWQWDQNQK